VESNAEGKRIEVGHGSRYTILQFITWDHRVAGLSPTGCMPHNQRFTYRDRNQGSMLGHFSK
jgi:hypothetical protein